VDGGTTSALQLADRLTNARTLASDGQFASLCEILDQALADLANLQHNVRELESERHTLGKQAARASALERRLAIAVAMLGAIERSKHNDAPATKQDLPPRNLKRRRSFAQCGR